MDFTQYQPVATPAFQPVPVPHTDQSYLHRPAPAPPRAHRAPLAISISSSHLEPARLPKTSTHPLLSASAFAAWEPSARHIQRQTSAPGHTSARRHGYSTRRQRSTENMPEQSYGAAYGGAGHGYQGQGPHPPLLPYYHHTRAKSCSTHSTTEVTV